MNRFICKQPITQGIFITLSMLASLADAADLSTENLRVNSSASSAAGVAQPQTAIQNITASPVATEAQTKKVITQPVLTPGAEQSLNPQPLPPGDGLIKPMSGARIEMAKPRIDSSIKASPGLTQPLPPGGGLIKSMPGASVDMAKPRIDTGIKASPGLIQPVNEAATQEIRPNMKVLAPWVPPGRITGATLNFTSTGATITIEGSGSCALNLIAMSNTYNPLWPRRVDEPPSYIGPLPTRIEVEKRVVNRRSVEIIGAGGPEHCAGYAGVHFYQ